MSLYGTRHHQHVCGFYYLESATTNLFHSPRRYLPPLSQSLHARIIASTSRTILTQTFANPSSTASIPELRYNFPLYDGVSVVAFTCTINKDRVIRGIVQEKNTARKTYDDAVANGQTAALFEQLPDASDVFTTTVGNVPAGAHISVEIVYLGELKHDAEVDGIRFTIPTSIAPRFGSYPGTLLDKPTSVSTQGGISIVVDAEVPAGSVIKSIQSPSHPIAVSVGSTSTMRADATPSLQFASATLSLGTAQLDDDFIIQVIATNTSSPVAVLETHPTISHQQALMATLVPKFKLAPTKPEIVFICDRSGSMQGNKIDDLKNALKVFLKSLPVGAMFNICSFGSSYSFLFDKSMTYDKNTLETAMKHVDTFDANYGGTQFHGPIQKTFELRHTDLDLEVFVLTDGEIWNEERLFTMVNDHVQKSQGAIRLFTLGVGRDVSHSLIEGLARAGNGFSQAVSENEKMSGKVVRMLKGALTPHVNDYTLEVKYDDAESETEPEDDFGIIEPATAASPKPLDQGVTDLPQKPISLFDSSADDDVDKEDELSHADGTGADRYSHVPAVKPPKLLQSPFQIPPLYPLSRTTVYLILSPDRELKDKTPQFLILRGTSPQGPLELQIPITILQDKAETIHQLAARKAVKELEEGRGWIFHAKAKDGQSLKDKHPGRFPTMVEREAVRLGIQFQVGGKWCSFVAVDSDPSRARSTEDELCAAAEMPLEYGGMAKRKMKKVGMGPAMSLDKCVVPSGSESLLFTSEDYSMSPPPRAGSMFASVNRLFGRAPSKTQSSHQSPVSQAFGMPTSTSAPGNPFGAPDKSSQPPAGRGFFGGPVSSSSPRTAFGIRSEGSSAGGLFGGQSSGFGGGLFSTGAPSSPPPPPLAAPALAPPAAEVDEALLEQYRKEMDYALCTPLDDMDDDDVASAAQQICQSVSPMPAAVGDIWTKPFYHSQTPADQFSALVSMQEFSGYWVWSDKLFAVLGVSPQDVKSTAEQSVQGSQDSASSSTAAVVAFLRKRLADERDCWEMMEEKAVAWLEAELGDESEKLLAALEQLF
ncbi:vault protein inter-alpha-trypsin [Colletotrichum graminicola]|uniref:Vault protein inter-alpha-trypsin n=1 Tax=Colletotrichum graminicola (strain M1.001 / M2 / FGSC 10212) TaxID=645133 RepID=E3QY35_COLGM|nr:vault protein inter-alpha-trypsin [Colletotrichum graminicola M1.001]EFQ35773.1 vault protein inter-alpha-trypsin [Colletotrichum graminicola M1.001]WDK12783.1 vault protein inter-alpha-trypsin [Colletotrichum graminicola]